MSLTAEPNHAANTPLLGWCALARASSPRKRCRTIFLTYRDDGLYHAYNAALKRATGGKGRAEMTLAELEAAVEWLGRNRLRDHLHLLDGNYRFGWRARRCDEWRPPAGWPAGSPGASRKRRRA